MAEMSPFELTETFYTGGLPRGRLPIYSTTLRGGRRHAHWCHNAREAGRLCARVRNTRSLELGPAVHEPDALLAIAGQRLSSPKLANVRGDDASVVALPALWVTIPFGAPRLPPDLRRALAVLDAIEHRPTLVISSAAAVHAFWHFEEPWLFLDQATAALHRAEAVSLLRRLEWAIACRAAGNGWRLPGAGRDAALAASFPLPGFLVAGDATGSQAVLESYPLVAGDGRFKPGDFDRLPEAPPPAPRPWRAVLAPPNAESTARLLPLAPVVRGCAWLRHCHTDRARLGRAELARATRLLLRCDAPGADRTGLVHELHGGHPGYDPHAVERTIRTELRAKPGPISCRRIGTTPGVVESHCAPCPHRGRIRGPLDLAREAAREAGEPRPPDRHASSAAAPSTAAPAPREPIPITDPQHEVNDRALAALAAAGAVFEHAGRLVEVVGGDGATRPVRAPRLRELLSRHCDFVAAKDGEPSPVRPPRWTVRALLARGSWPELPRLGAAAPPATPATAASRDSVSAPTRPPTQEEAAP